MHPKHPPGYGHVAECAVEAIKLRAEIMISVIFLLFINIELEPIYVAVWCVTLFVKLPVSDI